MLPVLPETFFETMRATIRGIIVRDIRQRKGKSAPTKRRAA